PEQRVVARSALDAVVAALARDQAVAGAAQQRVVAKAGGGPVAMDHVVAVAAVHPVIPGAGADVVGARPRLDGVVAGGAVQPHAVVAALDQLPRSFGVLGA